MVNQKQAISYTIYDIVFVICYARFYFNVNFMTVLNNNVINL
jgi:hypothetical protein